MKSQEHMALLVQYQANGLNQLEKIEVPELKMGIGFVYPPKIMENVLVAVHMILTGFYQKINPAENLVDGRVTWKGIQLMIGRDPVKFIESCKQVCSNIGKNPIFDKNIPLLINMLNTTGQFEVNETILLISKGSAHLWIWVKNVIKYYQTFQAAGQ